MGAKLCDSCKSATAILFCRPDSAFLCAACDSKIHAANKLASRHARVWVCEVCEQSPAAVTCKADAAHLCPTCDRDIHSANPLARRHARIPLAPFFDLNAAAIPVSGAAAANVSFKSKLFGEEDYCSDDHLDAEEAEAASWLLPNPESNPNLSKVVDPRSIDYLFADDEIDPYLDVDFSAENPTSAVADCVVPEQKTNHNQHNPPQSYFSFDYSAVYKPFSVSYAAPQPSLSNSLSSSSVDVGVVPDTRGLGGDVSTGLEKQISSSTSVAKVGIDREAKVLRYREKRKNRKFEKTIRYASRKAYAETRPRIKGRFAKRSDMEAVELVVEDAGYGVVPSF